ITYTTLLCSSTPSPSDIYTLSLHDALPISPDAVRNTDLILAMAQHHLERIEALGGAGRAFLLTDFASHGANTRGINDPIGGELRSEEHTSELQSRRDLVCRLLLEKKKKEK